MRDLISSYLDISVTTMEPTAGQTKGQSDAQRRLYNGDSTARVIFTCDHCDFQADSLPDLTAHDRQVHVQVTEPEQEEVLFISQEELLMEEVQEVTNNMRLQLQDEEEFEMDVKSEPSTYKCLSCDHRAEKADDLSKHFFDAHISEEAKKKRTLSSFTNNNYSKQKPKRAASFSVKQEQGQGDDDEVNNSHQRMPKRRTLSEATNCAGSKCPHCDETLKYPNLERHIKAVHLRLLNYVCDECGVAKVDQGELNRHIKKMHTGVPDKVCEMPGCDFKAVFFSDLAIHAKGKRHMTQARLQEIKLALKKLKKKSPTIRRRKSKANLDTDWNLSYKDGFRKKRKRHGHGIKDQIRTVTKCERFDAGNVENKNTTKSSLQNAQNEKHDEDEKSKSDVDKVAIVDDKVDPKSSPMDEKAAASNDDKPPPPNVETSAAKSVPKTETASEKTQSIGVLPKVDGVEAPSVGIANKSGASKTGKPRGRPRKNEIKCDFCNCKFGSSKALEMHKRMSHMTMMPSNNGYKCPDCGKEYPTKSGLISHQTFAHHRRRINDEGYKCPECGISFISELFLNKHRREKHSSRCAECGKGFEDESALNEHFVKFHKKKEKKQRMKCVDCDFVTVDGIALTKHVRANHKNRSKKTKAERVLSRIERVSVTLPHIDLLKPCTLCTFVAKNDDDLKKHREIHNRPSPTLTLTTSENAEKVKTPKSDALDNLTHECSLCEHKEPSESLIERHIETFHAVKTVQDEGNQGPAGGRIGLFDRLQQERSTNCILCGRKIQDTIEMKIHWLNFHKISLL